MTEPFEPTSSAESGPSRRRIREILLQDWDPHELLARPEAHGAYDAWVEPLAQFLADHPNEERVMDWLHEREEESMCFPSLGKERLRRAARKLLAL